jgi:6-phosphogluconolactonase
MSLPPGERIEAELAEEGVSVPDIVIEPDADRLARAVASAFVARVAAAQAVHGVASVVLTGGGVDVRVHAMPASDGEFATAEEAADWYAGELAELAGGDGDLPRFDVLLLGMGPEGHVASIFPDSPATQDDRPVLPVHDCPKPPPTRISLGFSAINTAEEVWLLVAGEAKAEAVARGVRGASGTELPAGAVHGRRATRWLLDEGAASRLPEP